MLKVYKHFYIVKIYINMRDMFAKKYHNIKIKNETKYIYKLFRIYKHFKNHVLIEKNI